MDGSRIGVGNLSAGSPLSWNADREQVESLFPAGPLLHGPLDPARLDEARRIADLLGLTSGDLN